MSEYVCNFSLHTDSVPLGYTRALTSIETGINRLRQNTINTLLSIIRLKKEKNPTYSVVYLRTLK